MKMNPQLIPVPTLLIPILALTLSGCGNLTVGGIGDVEVIVTGDENPSEPEPLSVVRSRPRDPIQSESNAEGSVQAEFQLFLVDADQQAIPLSNDPVQLSLDVQGRDQRPAVRSQVRTGSYLALRLVFSDVRADIRSGLIIDGTPVVGDVRVQLRGSTLVVTLPLNVEVREEESLSLLVDFNSGVWLRAADPTARRVQEEAFRDAITVRLR